MNATLSEAIQLVIGAVMGVGLSVSMEKNGFSIFKRDSRMKGLGVLIIFCSAWVVGLTLLAVVFGE